ncbi:MAG: hypothetical protein ACI86H_002432 [bacterium]|jgi:uncharacterized protein YecE (DUF72 family)
MGIEKYYLGCAIWGNQNWLGKFFTESAKPTDFLKQYTTAFNTVEGNNTFYGTPKIQTVEKWLREVDPKFQFSFKIPRQISHDLKLYNASKETSHFFKTLEVLESALGVFFLQLPPDFSPRELSTLEKYLKALPKDFSYAVEVRHLGFFNRGEEEKSLNRLLHSHGIDRVCLDSRALFSAKPDREIIRLAQKKKPQLPVHVVGLCQSPFIRFIGHPDVEANTPFLEQWVKKFVQWIQEGKTPRFFAHTPNNSNAPNVARLFHQLLQKELADVGELPIWPANQEVEKQQLSLF